MVLTAAGAIPDEEIADVQDGARGLLFKAMRRATNKLGV